MTIGHRLSCLALPVVDVSRTIDNHLCSTDRSVDFCSALAVLGEALHGLETTACGHDRVMIAESMGRYAG